MLFSMITTQFSCWIWALCVTSRYQGWEYMHCYCIVMTTANTGSTPFHHQYLILKCYFRLWGLKYINSPAQQVCTQQCKTAQGSISTKLVQKTFSTSTTKGLHLPKHQQGPRSHSRAAPLLPYPSRGAAKQRWGKPPAAHPSRCLRPSQPHRLTPRPSPCSPTCCWCWGRGRRAAPAPGAGPGCREAAHGCPVCPRAWARVGEVRRQGRTQHTRQQDQGDPKEGRPGNGKARHLAGVQAAPQPLLFPQSGRQIVKRRARTRIQTVMYTKRKEGPTTCHTWPFCPLVSTVILMLGTDPVLSEDWTHTHWDPLPQPPEANMSTSGTHGQRAFWSRTSLNYLSNFNSETGDPQWNFQNKHSCCLFLTICIFIVATVLIRSKSMVKDGQKRQTVNTPLNQYLSTTASMAQSCLIKFPQLTISSIPPFLVTQETPLQLLQNS